MRPLTLPAIIVAFGALSSEHVNAKSAVESYCLKEELSGATGKHTISLGTAIIWLSINVSTTPLRVYFMDAMPDSRQVLLIENAKATETNPHEYKFHFIDNWNNAGFAKLSIDRKFARIEFGDMKSTTEFSPSKNARRGYGTFVLTSAACAKDRHTFPKKLCPDGTRECFSRN